MEVATLPPAAPVFARVSERWIVAAVIDARRGTAPPHVTRQRPIPLAVVEYELIDVADVAQPEPVGDEVVERVEVHVGEELAGLVAQRQAPTSLGGGEQVVAGEVALDLFLFRRGLGRGTRRAAPALRWASRARLVRPALRVGQSRARSLARSAALFDAPALRRRSPESRRQT